MRDFTVSLHQTRLLTIQERREVEDKISEVRYVYAELMTKVVACAVPRMVIYENGLLTTIWPLVVQRQLDRLQEQLEHEVMQILCSYGQR